MINFHTIGDSHASEITWGKVSVPGLNVITHHLGPMTCASFGISWQYIDYNPEDWLCFCFGEIDCRNHLGKYDNWWELANGILNRYFDTIKKYNGARIFVFNIVPANRQLSAAGDPWPCVGSDEQRREFVRYMNGGMRVRCINCGYTFFDVHDKYADENGYLDLKYRDAGTHIIDPIFINEFLRCELQ